MNPVRGIGVAMWIAGAAVMAASSGRSHDWIIAHVSAASPVRVDWLFLIGIVSIASGGLMVQFAQRFAWRTVHA